MSPQYIHRLESPSIQGKKGFWHIRRTVFLSCAFMIIFHKFPSIFPFPDKNTAAQNERLLLLFICLCIGLQGIAGLPGLQMPGPVPESESQAPEKSPPCVF